MRDSYIHSFGAHVPDRVVTNAELAPQLGCTPEWIESVSGIRERRWAGEENVADLATAAARDCLRKAGIEASQLGLILLSSGSAERRFPGPASTVAAALGLNATPAIDLPIASAGSIFGLSLASQLAGTFGDVLVVAAEKMSAVVQGAALDQNTAILFGDGAGAALVSSRPGRFEVLDSVLHTDGAFREDLTLEWGSALQMKGLTVILQAARKLPAVIDEVLKRQNIDAKDVVQFVMHQANQNLITRVAKGLGVDASLMFSNVARYGNTSSASMLIAAAEWEPVAGPVVFAGFGAGFNWGALVARG
ncbi:MAG TPA: ketoacyl-ACP synthase III [Bryobacteraceae bacterium]|jgi:3-oxoacyl-[acyl-carrier-protein] synthase-3|nr:ketoacyl-ACP synthase III [Bryobacteraceae bacterium]